VTKAQNAKGQHETGLGLWFGKGITRKIALEAGEVERRGMGFKSIQATK